VTLRACFVGSYLLVNAAIECEECRITWRTCRHNKVYQGHNRQRWRTRARSSSGLTNMWPRRSGGGGE
jgi:hypothetical protein